MSRQIHGRFFLALFCIHLVQAEQIPRPSVLFVEYRKQEHYFTYFKQYLRELHAKGFEVNHLTLEDPIDELSKFDVIVYLNVPNWDSKTQEITEDFKLQCVKLNAFLKNGGGVLMMSAPGAWRFPTLWHLLRPHGLTVLPATIHDSQTRQATLVQAPFAYTRNLAKHPVTANVRGIWFPVYSDGAQVWNANTSPFAADDTWEVLVRGEESSWVRPYSFNLERIDALKPEKEIRGDIPLLAVKEVKPGRLAFCGVDSSYHIFGGRAPAWEGITMGAGLNGKPSDFDPLMRNLLSWLAAPSLAKNSPDKAKTDVSRIQSPKLSPPTLRMSWGFGEPEKSFHGVIGARSLYSGGKSSVAQYAQAARQAGYSFLFFAEDLQKTSEANFEKLKVECKQHSSDDLLLLAGLDCEDETGNHYVMLQPNVKWPSKNLLLEDRRVFRVLSDKARGLPFAQYARQNYPHLLAFYRGKGGVPWWDTRCYRQCIPLYTFRNGQQVDELTDEFLELADAGEWPVPIVLNFLDSAEALLQAKKQALPHTVLLGRELSQFREKLTEAPAFQPTAWVTNGPEIDTWQWGGQRDYVANGNWFDWSRYRWLIRFKVRSDAGLKEVRIMDGPKLFRRYLPAGKKSYEKTIHLTHNQQKNLILIVEDTEGRKAWGGELLDRSHLMEVVYCSDRMNTLSYACLPSKGPFGSTVGTWPVVTMPKGPLTDNLFNQLNLDMFRFPGYDGQPGGHLLMTPAPYVWSEEEVEGGAHLNRRILRPMASADVAIQETTFEHKFAKGVKVWNAWNNLGPIVPTRLFKGKLRYTTFMHPGHLPAPVLVEGEIEMLKDGVFSSKRQLPIQIGFIGAPRREAGYDHVSIRHTDHDIDFSFNYDGKPQIQRRSSSFPSGAYTYYYHSLFGPGGFFSLTDGLSLYYVGTNLYRCNIGFKWQKKQFKKGDRIPFRYIALTGGYNDPPSNRLAEEFRDQLGLDGTPAYSVDAEQGTLESTRYVCVINGEQKGFAGTISTAKPLRAILPIKITNLNERWSSIYYDRTKKRYRPVSMHEGSAFAHLDLTQKNPKPQKIFVGHPFTCDRPEVFLTLVQTGEKEFLLSAHNPTPKPLNVKITKSIFFDLPSKKEMNVEIAPGEEIVLKL